MTSEPLRRCLLLAGGWNHANNYPRYNRDLLWWSEGLVGAGFECWACLGEGAVKGHKSLPIKFTSAQLGDVSAALGWLSEVGDGDLGILVVSNHGVSSGIRLWHPDILTPDRLALAIDPAKGNMVLIMGQCCGGIFGKLAGPKSVVVSACAGSESSHSSPDGKYDEFLYQLGTALFGAPADAPQSGPGQKLSLFQAFDWARVRDRWKSPPLQETPTIFDPAGLAKKLFI